jgi:eukaryotic-like serine/threonine-protein kinase
MLFAAGVRLGPYEIVTPVGAGGMGEVYRGRDTRLDRTVAIKVLPSEAPAPEWLERFRREARAISRLMHPHICALHDVGEHNGVAFLVMEYLEGQTLAERLEKGALPLEQVLDFGAQIADALDRAHREGVVHRDLKPTNIMLTRDGVKLLDFGLAKLVETARSSPLSVVTATKELTEDGKLVGSVPYMAPEQAEGHEADARTDVFALGVTLYEMSTGRRPFRGESTASLIVAIMTSEPAPVSSLRPLAPPRLERVVGRCLAKDPEARWQSARDLAAELRWIAEEPASTRPAVGEKQKRRPLPMVGVLAAVAAAGAAASVLGLRPRTPIPSFHRMTFRRGTVSSARFAPDGQTIVYSAAWESRPYELFQTREGSVEYRPLGLSGARILSISRGGEMALLLDHQTFLARPGTVARVPLAGGVPRELLENVIDADWTPDGSLAVLVSRGDMRVVEFPQGTKVYESRERLRFLRVSPRGDQLAFIEGVFAKGDVVLLDRSGRKRVLSRGWAPALGLAWSPGGDEVWFTGARGDDVPSLHAVSLSGGERVLARAPDPILVQDVSREGRVLLTNLSSRDWIICLPPGETKESDLGWLDASGLEALSRDGRTLVFGETHLGGGASGAIYIRKTDGSPAVRLADGYPEDLSPDGKWILGRPTKDAHEWVLVPTGPGSIRRLPRGRLTHLYEADFLPDGRRIVFAASEEGHGTRAYVQDVEGGEPRAISPEGIWTTGLPTPDGRFVPGSSGGHHSLYPVDGGEPRPLPVLKSDDIPLQWSGDGHFLYVRRGRTVPAETERVDMETGRREHWKTLMPSDPLGVEAIDTILITPDGRSYCYDPSGILTDLYVAEGVK